MGKPLTVAEYVVFVFPPAMSSIGFFWIAANKSAWHVAALFVHRDSGLRIPAASVACSIPIALLTLPGRI